MEKVVDSLMIILNNMNKNLKSYDDNKAVEKIYELSKKILKEKN